MVGECACKPDFSPNSIIWDHTLFHPEAFLFIFITYIVAFFFDKIIYWAQFHVQIRQISVNRRASPYRPPVTAIYGMRERGSAIYSLSYRKF